MKSRKKIFVGAAFLCVLVGVLVFMALPLMRTPPFPIPDTATWVRYQSTGAGSPGPGFQEWTRFNAPLTACDAAAVAILEDFKAEQSKWFADHPFVIERKVIDPAASAPKIGGPWWFTPHEIIHGTAYYLEGPIGPSIWVDADHGVVYHFMSD